MYVIIFSVSFNKWEFSKFSTNIFNRRCMPHYFEFQTSKRKWIHRKRKCGKIRCFRRFALRKSQPRSLYLLFEGPWCLSSVVCHGFIRLIPGTLPAEMFGGSDFWLETRVIIKISKKMIPHMKPKVFFIRKKQNKNPKWPTQKKVIFQNRQFSIFFSENFMDWSLG